MTSEPYPTGTQVLIGPTRDIAAEITTVAFVVLGKDREWRYGYEVAWFDGSTRCTANMETALFTVVSGPLESDSELVQEVPGGGISPSEMDALTAAYCMKNRETGGTR